MFEELLEEYQKLPIDSKRHKAIDEIKLVVAMLQLLCDQKSIKYEELKIADNKNYQDESEYLDIVYSYITRLKEQLGNYIIYNEEKK